MFLGNPPRLGGDLRIDVKDSVGAVPNVKPFQSVAQRVAGHTLEQEQRFSGVDIQRSGKVMIRRHGLHLAGATGWLVAMVPHQT